MWDYPRPPRLRGDQREVIVRAMRVLETASPPTFYLPFDDIEPGVLVPASGSSYCEWKGSARYWSVRTGDQTIDGAAWSYPDPAPAFEAIRKGVAFYASRLACTVNGERVRAQPGRFYGGWTPTTSWDRSRASPVHWAGESALLDATEAGRVLTGAPAPFLRAIRRFAPRPNRGPRRWVVMFYDQLRPRHPLLTGPPANTGVLYIESTAKPARRRYHAQKLVLLLSAMRHDAEARGRAGHPVRYHVSDAWYGDAIAEARERYQLEDLHALEPAEAEVREPLRTLAWLTLHPNTLFATDATFYRRVFPKRGTRRLETFYRAARRATGLLMDGREPTGGAWNYDAENRKAWKGDPPAPAALTFTPDAVTREVMTLVATRYPASLGAVDGFAWPVTAEEAERAVDTFIVERLRWFGPFEDAMAKDAPELFHSTLSAPLNLGLLDPLDLCRRVDAAYRSGGVPLASAEGFVRQVLGWREFVRHVYEEHRAHYATANALAADLPLPSWYWGEPSGMHCLDTTVAGALARGYTHHIPRLMVLSNIATLLGVDPQALNRWFWEVYVDAYEWVVTPNVVGMATWADGGIVGSKPYVSSGKYIQRMGPSLCAGCRFDPATTSGAAACPLNHLYWDFLERHRARFAANVRMAVPLAALKKLPQAVMTDHREHAAEWRARAAGVSHTPRTG